VPTEAEVVGFPGIFNDTGDFFITPLTKLNSAVYYANVLFLFWGDNIFSITALLLK
jgi:hypothetical protein